MLSGLLPMSRQFRPITRDTPYLLPPAIQDWLPDEHLARFIVEIVDQLDLGAIERDYGGGGKAAYLSISAGVPAVLWLRHGRVLEPPAGAGNL